MANFKTGSGSHGGLKVRNLIERWLTAEEERRLLSASPEWLQEIIVFAANTGLRQSEILNLQWSNVDLFRRARHASGQCEDAQRAESQGESPIAQDGLCLLQRGRKSDGCAGSPAGVLSRHEESRCETVSVS